MHTRDQIEIQFLTDLIYNNQVYQKKKKEQKIFCKI